LLLPLSEVSDTKILSPVAADPIPVPSAAAKITLSDPK
jgi:hypothetical protein